MGLEGFIKEVRIVLGNAKQGINKNILNFYGAVLRDDPTLPLLAEILKPRPPASAAADFPRCGPQLPMAHTGQMGSEHPLTHSQRQALHSLTQTPSGRLLAVNGPPGTGKTTFLQSVVASAWVDAAIEGREPPVILACSSNNQAVTNILDTFAKATKTGTASKEEKEAFAPRWLPNIDSYGLYLPSQSRFQDSDYLAAMPGYPRWQGLPEDMENGEYVQQAGTEYLEHARRALGDRSLDLDRAVARLHQEIQSSASLLRQTIEAAHKVWHYRAEANVQGAESVARHLQAVITHAKSEIERYRGVLSDIRITVANAPWYERLLLDWNPTRKWAVRQITRRLVVVFDQNNVPKPDIDPDLFEESLERHISALTGPHEVTLGHARQWQRIERDFATNVQRLPDVDSVKLNPIDHPSSILKVLDIGLRRHLFLLTARYYEGRWLLEMRDLLDQGAKMDARSRNACESRWCVFRRKSAIDSDSSRPPIPTQVGHRFRFEVGHFSRSNRNWRLT